MRILALIISILKVVGIIILVILALILLILLAILFSSIKIKSSVKINSEIDVYFELKYLFGIIRFYYDKSIIKFKIFGVNLFGIKKHKKSKKIQKFKTKKDELQKDEEVLISKDLQEQTLDIFSEDVKEESLEDTIKNEDKKKSESFNIKRIKEIFILIKNNTYLMEYVKILLKRLIKAIKLKKIILDFEYGFDDPSQTGKTCAIISIILPVITAKNIKKIKLIPNFQKEIFIGQGYVEIKTNIFKILIPILIFILKKPIRKMIFRKER